MAPSNVSGALILGDVIGLVWRRYRITKLADYFQCAACANKEISKAKDEAVVVK